MIPRKRPPVSYRGPFFCTSRRSALVLIAVLVLILLGIAVLTGVLILILVVVLVLILVVILVLILVLVLVHDGHLLLYLRYRDSLAGTGGIMHKSGKKSQSAAAGLFRNRESGIMRIEIFAEEGTVMRTLAAISLSFAAAVFAAALLPWSGWTWWAAIVCGVLGLAAVLLRRRLPDQLRLRAAVILFSLCGGLLYFGGYQALIQQPVLERCGREAEFSAVVADFGQLTEQGGRVTVYPEELRGVKAVCYGGQELSRLEPGQRITGYARWQDAGRIHENDVTTFTSRGVFALLYVQGDVTEEAGSAGSLRWLPQRTARALREKIAAIWDDETTAAFVTAELTGDRGGLSVADETAMSQAGLSHLFAVSGLHCAFLVSLLGLLLGSRRRLSAGVSMAVLAFYMLVVGLSPSVVRACIMQTFVLAAPLFKRDSDGLTSLGAALLVILLANPFAAGSISLQLSFAATLGLVWLSPKLYRNLSLFYTGTSRAFRWAVNFLCANVSASVSALVFTIPLTAIYFNILTLTAPISNLLAVPAAGWNFMAGFVTVLAGFVWLPAARVLGWVCFGLVRYVLWVAGVLASAPGHAVYFSNGFLKYWLLYVYAMFGGCLLTRDRRRKYAVAGVLAAATLALAVGLNTGLHQYGHLSVMALDVGQGESVALYTREKAVLVDCGSSNSYISAGARAADQLESMGIHRLSAVAVTHYHADHTNGLEELLARMPVERLLLPEIQDEYGVRDRLLALARELDIPVTMVTDTYQFPMGQAMLTIYPPVGAGDLNEQGLTFLCSAGDFDALITGDMAGNTEKKLVERFDLPDIEVLVVGHHGSRYSSTDAFLQQVRPETAIISVGDNSYGHPTQEAMDRLSRNGAAVYRTDRQGNVLVTVNGGT